MNELSREEILDAHRRQLRARFRGADLSLGALDITTRPAWWYPGRTLHVEITRAETAPRIRMGVKESRYRREHPDS